MLLLYGKPLRGRWGSVESIEKTIHLARAYIGPVMEGAFAEKASQKAAKAKAAKARAASKSKDEFDQKDKDDYAEKVRNYKMTSVECSNSLVFKLTASVAYVGKKPLTSFMHWHMKQIKIHNKKVKAAKELGKTYMGATPLSKIVTFKAEAVAKQFDDMLKTSVWCDPDLLGSVLTEDMPEDLQEAARRLHVLVVTQGACSWNFRVLTPAKSFPLLT